MQAAFAESLLLTGNVKFDDKSGAKSVAYAVDAFKQDIMRKFGNGSNAGSSVM